MELPNTAYEVELDVPAGEVSFYRRSNHGDVNPETIRLPKWLASKIRYHMEIATKVGEENIKSSFKELMMP